MNEVIKCLVERRSCKKYLPKQVDEAALQEILLAGTYAPSGKNRQAAKILVLQKPEDIAAVERLNAAVLGTPDGRPFYGAPTVLVVLAEENNPIACEKRAASVLKDGVVVDYINLLFMQFAVFNLADICVCVGVGLWVLEIFLEELHGGAKEQ